MNKWGFFPPGEKKRTLGIFGVFYYEARKYQEIYACQIANRRARFPKRLPSTKCSRTHRCYQLEIYYSKIAIYACQTCLRELRVFVEIKKKAALRTGNLKNISALSSTARTSRNWNASRALRLYGYMEFWKIQLVNENISRPSTVHSARHAVL